eukprot:m.235078 g.235078  ORF g.235078 m.235078 type:complete len:100 (-) comp15759_c0_seq5:117-416(-)
MTRVAMNFGSETQWSLFTISAPYDGRKSDRIRQKSTLPHSTNPHKVPSLERPTSRFSSLFSRHPNDGQKKEIHEHTSSNSTSTTQFNPHNTDACLPTHC